MDQGKLKSAKKVIEKSAVKKRKSAVRRRVGVVKRKIAQNVKKSVSILKILLKLSSRFSLKTKRLTIELASFTFNVYC